MSVLLESQIRSLEEQQAADSRFFINEVPLVTPEEQHAKATNDFAHNFWLRNYDLLHEGVGVVLQTGVDSNRELVKPEGPVSQENMSLLFDARAREKGVFGWQLSFAGTNGREIYQLETTPEGYQAKRIKLNAQGKLQSVEELTEIEGLAKQIKTIALDEQTRNTIAMHRQKRSDMERALSAFSVGQLRKLSPELYERRLKQQQAMIDTLGFVALKPYVAP